MKAALGCLLTLCVIGLASGAVRRLGVSSPELPSGVSAVESADLASNPTFEPSAPAHSSPDRTMALDLQEAEEETEDSEHLSAVLTAVMDRPIPPSTIRPLARPVGIDGFRTSIRSPLLRC